MLYRDTGGYCFMVVLYQIDRDHLNMIFQICGTPDDEMMSKIISEDVSGSCYTMLTIIISLSLSLLFPLFIYRHGPIFTVYRNLTGKLFQNFLSELIL